MNEYSYLLIKDFLIGNRHLKKGKAQHPRIPFSRRASERSCERQKVCVCVCVLSSGRELEPVRNLISRAQEEAQIQKQGGKNLVEVFQIAGGEISTCAKKKEVSS